MNVVVHRFISLLSSVPYQASDTANAAKCGQVIRYAFTVNDAIRIETRIAKKAMLETNRGLLIFIDVFLTNSGTEDVQANRDADLNKTIQVVK
nr:MAG TPA: hypothetical protein [Bacteriophage sp.]